MIEIVTRKRNHVGQLTGEKFSVTIPQNGDKTTGNGLLATLDEAVKQTAQNLSKGATKNKANKIHEELGVDL